MLALIWGAVRTRRAQVLTVLVLTALAAAVAAAGPWFAVASMTRAAAADVAAAPAGQRVVSVRQTADTNGDPQGVLDQLSAKVSGLLPLPVSDAVSGMVLSMTINRGGETPAMAIAYRDDFCAHVRLDGRCPAAAGEVAVSRNSAQQLGVAPGDRISLRESPTTEPVMLTVVAQFDRTDPTGPYWSNTLYLADGEALDPVFTPISTFLERQLWEPTVSLDMQVPDALLRGDGGYDLGQVLRLADVQFGVAELRLVNPTANLLATIAADRSQIRLGVLVAMVQILVLAWFAIGLAGRYTGRDRRGDAALLKLRGSTRGGTLRLAWGQHLVPLVLGAVAGYPVGWLLARALAGSIHPADDRRAALFLSLAAVAAVLVGGLLVLALVEGLVLRQPVAALLRQVGSGRGDWRAGLIDLLLLAVAVAAIYQSRTGSSVDGLALAAPAMVALAVALLLARLLGRVADRGGGAAVRAGRLRLGLTAVQVSRQPGSDRVFALVVVAVAMFAVALGGWRGEQVARSERSAAELGATRVLTVQAANRSALLSAVRRADPGGREAMAAVVDASSSEAVLAVDSGRLAAVARWQPEFGAVGALPDAVADAPGPSPLPMITGDRLTVRLRSDSSGGAAALAAVLLNDRTGAPVPVRFGTLGRGEQTLSAAVSGCTEAPGCRLLRWELTTPPDALGRTEPAPYGTVVTLRALAQQHPTTTILSADKFGDITRWRPSTVEAALDVTARGGALRFAIDQNPLLLREVGYQVWSVGTPLPLPVVLAGTPPKDWQFDEPTLTSLARQPVPVRVAGSASVLPVLGREGVLVDLEATRLIIGDLNPPGVFQVWLAPTAGPEVVDALTKAGLLITADDTVAARSGRLGEQAPAEVTRFALVCGVVGLLLAAAAIGVAGAVDRRIRHDQLSSLRVQGLARRVAVSSAYAGTGALIVGALIGGLLAAALALPLARVVVPAFTDGWDVLPPPAALGGASLALAGLVALAVLGLVGWLSVLPLVRKLRDSGRRRGREGTR